MIYIFCKYLCLVEVETVSCEIYSYLMLLLLRLFITGHTDAMFKFFIEVSQAQTRMKNDADEDMCE